MLLITLQDFIDLEESDASVEEIEPAGEFSSQRSTGNNEANANGDSNATQSSQPHPDSPPKHSTPVRHATVTTHQSTQGSPIPSTSRGSVHSTSKHSTPLRQATVTAQQNTQGSPIPSTSRGSTQNQAPKKMKKIDSYFKKQAERDSFLNWDSDADEEMSVDDPQEVTTIDRNQTADTVPEVHTSTSSDSDTFEDSQSSQGRCKRKITKSKKYSSFYEKHQIL